MLKEKLFGYLSLSVLLGISLTFAAPAFAGEIVIVKGQRYERCGDKLYPQIDASYTDLSGHTEQKWITDYSSYVAPQANPLQKIPAPGPGASSSARAVKASVPAANPQTPSPVSVRDWGKKHFISISADTLFDFDKDVLTPKAEAVLASVAPMIKKYGNCTVEIDGHTDNIGTDAYNQDLSERRAKTVRDRLAALGAVSDNATIRGFGSRSPVSNNCYGDGTDFPQGRAKNRRVEITVETIEETGGSS